MTNPEIIRGLEGLKARLDLAISRLQQGDQTIAHADLYEARIRLCELERVLFNNLKGGVQTAAKRGFEGES